MACNLLLELLLLLMLLTSMTIQVNASRLLSEEQPDSSFELETISGFVFCDSCHENQLSKSSVVFQGVQVLINCSSNGTNFSGIAVTSKTGEYRIQLPSNIVAPSCSAQLLAAPSLSSCSGQLQARTRTATNHDIVYKPYKALPSCTRRQALTLGPPDPPNPSGKLGSPPARSSSSSSFKTVKGLHLGPPDPPRPVSRSKRLGPSHG